MENEQKIKQEKQYFKHFLFDYSYRLKKNKEKIKETKDKLMDLKTEKYFLKLRIEILKKNFKHLTNKN